MSIDRHAFTVLEVDDGDALWLAGYEAPQTRTGMYDISPDGVADAKILLGQAKDCVPLADHLRYEFECFRSDLEDELAGLEKGGGKAGARANALRAQLEKLPEDPEDGPGVWLPAMTSEEFALLRVSIVDWLADSPDRDYEEDYFPIPADGRTAAMQILQSEDPDTLDALGVVIIEGEHPGSTYYAAELEVPLAEANRAAERLGLTYRFVRQGEAEADQDGAAP